jgi:hypothetical protein
MQTERSPLTSRSLPFSLARVPCFLRSSSMDDHREVLLHRRFFLLAPPVEFAIVLHLSQPTSLSLSLFGAAASSSRATDRGRTAAGGTATIELPVHVGMMPWAIDGQTEATFRSAGASWCFHTSSLSVRTAGAAPPSSRPPPRRLLPWPAGCSSSRAEPSGPMSARGFPGAPPPLSYGRQVSYGRLP